MTHIKKIKYIMLTVIALIVTSCTGLLEEEPRTQLVPSFFATPEGLLGGIAGAYDAIRNSYGTQGHSLQQMAGTDEYLRGAGSTSGNQRLFDYNGIAAGDFNQGFTVYSAINTLNGILELGPSAGLSAEEEKLYLGQAYFLRAFLYFDLVQTYGDVPLHTEFNTTPSQADHKTDKLEIYEVIIADLIQAVDKLPYLETAPFLGKAATKAAAKFLLGKVYLTRGWLINSTPDFEAAYLELNDLITNQADYGLELWEDYDDVFDMANDYGKENIFVSDHSNDPKFGRYTSQASGGGAQNLTPWFGRWNYSGTVLGIDTDYDEVSDTWAPAGNMMTRDVNNGRPYLRIRLNSENITTGPNAGLNYLYDQAFVDRNIDTRYDKTFQTVWIANQPVTGTRGSLSIGDTAVWFIDHEDAGAPYNVDGRPFKGLVVTPSMHNNQVWPAVKKFDDLTRAHYNDPSTRPVVLYRLADAYLLAAEAALKAGNAANAVPLINAVRERAAYKSTNTAGENSAAAIAMRIDVNKVTLDFILDERTREFYGEGLRRTDLVRTQSLIRRVQLWNPVEAGTNIKEYHVLRPIPQDQIDRVTQGDCQGNECWQNEGYY